jgi:hypothetical protein
MTRTNPRCQRRLWAPPLGAVALILAGIANAQDNATPPDATSQTVAPTTARVFTPTDFERFAPRNALDMLNRVPGFSIQRQDQGQDDGEGRGLGQAGTNVLINGQRLSSKSQDIFDQLQRVTVDNVERIEIVDGTTLDLPGLSGQVANVVTRYGDIGGRYEWRTIHRPKYADPSWWGGDVSVNGSAASIEWNAAYTHGTGRGGAGGLGVITDAVGDITESRDVLIKFNGEFPRLSGSLKWTGDRGTVANLNVEYNRTKIDSSNDEDRDPLTDVGSFRDFDNNVRGSGYEIGGDIEFGLGPGKLKVIGLERNERNDFGQTARVIFEDDSPTTGSRFLGTSAAGERIARSEYRWDMWGGNFQVDLEAAYNELDQTSQLFSLDPAARFTEIALPNSSGQVQEDRYEVILSYGRTLANGLTLRAGAGTENSTLEQTGPSGLTREFRRPKGSLSLAWPTREGLNVSLNLERRVGQLSFGDFLASVALALDNTDAGNVELVPTLTTEANVQLEKNWGGWGSSNLRVYRRWLDDYIDIIPISGGGESSGNISEANLYGFNLSSTVNFDPAGWEGARVDLNLTMEESGVADPLTGAKRSFSNFYDRRANLNLRHDVPGTDWAWGIGAQYNHVQPSYRLSQVAVEYEGPTYTFGFVEHKDFHGLTVNFQIFNLTDGRAIFYRTVYDGLRTAGNVSFNETRDLSVQPIFRLQLKGSF